MTKTNHYVRALWLGCSLFLALFLAPSCARESDDDLELNDASEALTQAEYDCEWDKRECFIVAGCDAIERDACERAFHACREPVRDERARVRELCRAQRDACEAASTSEAEHFACHVAEHECKLPVDPPEAICHVDALRCIWDVRAAAPDPGPPAHHAAEHACHEEEHACKESLRLDRADLPAAPKCEPLACKSAHHACQDLVRAERERVHALCRADRESCELVATNDAARHACHVAEHRCKLPVDPPEAICHLEALECRWDAGIPDLTPPPPPPHDEPSVPEQVCREAEHDCVEARRVHPGDRPWPALCSPLPLECSSF